MEQSREASKLPPRESRAANQSVALSEGNIVVDRTVPGMILPAAAGEGGKSMAELDARLVQHRLKAERQARALRTQAIMLHRRLATLTQPAAHVELVAPDKVRASPPAFVRAWTGATAS